MDILVKTPDALDAQEIATWRGLQDETGRDSPFLSPDWALACAAVDGPDRRRARVAIIQDRGRAVGFLPARVSRFAAMPVGAPMCDYQAWVAEPGVQIDPRALVRALCVGRFDFAAAPAELSALQPFMRGAAQTHVVDLSQGYEAYAAARRAAGRDILQDTAKKRRKLEREHGAVVFAASRAPEDFDALIDWKRTQYKTTGQTDIFEAGWTGALLRRLFERPDPAFGGALFTLRVGDRLAATHFALRRGAVLHAWFIAHDEAFARYSPGVILIADMLRWAGEAGVRELDLGPGDYRFKQSLANVTREVAHGYVGRASPASLMRAAAYRVRDAAEALPLGRVSALPGKAMRRLDLRRGLAG